MPAPDWFWVRVAIKGGLTAVIAIIWFEWLNPPGSGAFPLMAWTLAIMGRPFLRAGGSGDLRAFQTALAGSLVLFGCAVLLLLITPFLANYRRHESNVVPRVVCVRIHDRADCRR